MVEIHMYGKLRRHANGCRPGQACVVTQAPRPEETIASLLVSAGIPADEISHIFLNAKLLASRNRMASMYGYQQVSSDLTNWDLDVPVSDGDRIGLFGKDMVILGM